MINHARTLLLNMDGDKRPAPGFFLEEYVDTAYKALVLPQFLINVRDIVLGRNSDNAFKNLRLWQCMHFLQSTEFQSYALALDPRITYDHSRAVEAAYCKAVGLDPLAEAIPVYFLGELAAAELSQRLQYDWLVEVLGPLLVRTKLMQTGEVNETTLTITNGLTNVITLAGRSTLLFRLGTSTPLTTGSSWQLTAFARSAIDITGLESALTSMGDETYSQLFGTLEPYKTFRQLWDHHPFIQYKLSGMLLAYCYRAEGVRLNGQ